MTSNLKIVFLVLGVLAFAGALAVLAWKLEDNAKSEQTVLDKRIGEDVVATYVGGEITAQELRNYINKVTAGEGRHTVCEKHGADHSKCDGAEKCETHPLESAESYRIFLREMVMERMVDRWVREKGMLARKDVGHKLKHLVEEINLDALAGKMHSDKLKPDRVEMQQYYEEHKDEYQNLQFADVEKEIEKKLIAKKQAEYIPKYIEELKQNAAIERNYALLEVAEPTDSEIRSYYDEHRKEFVRPDAVRIQYLKFPAAGDEKGAREKAESALAKVRAGGEIGKVADELGAESSTSEYLEKDKPSSWGAEFLDTVFRYQRGETTQVLKDGGAFYVARVTDRVGSETKPLEAVRGDVKASVYLAKERAKLEQNKNEALFSLHGKRFSVEEFLQEFDELSTEQKRQFASLEAKKNLLDQLVVKELLMEKAEDDGQDKQQRESRDDLKRAALAQMLHKEGVDEKIDVPDAEVNAFYEKYKDRLVEPAKAKVSIIRLRIGFSDDERKRAKERMDQALAKLRAGTDFAAAAKEYSEDWTATRGGELDQWIYEGASHLAEAYEHGFHNYVFALTAGQTSDVFEFRNNYWIVKMRERADARQQTLEEAKPRIVEVLKAARHETRTREMENELLEQSQLVIRDFVLSRLLAAESRGHAGEDPFVAH